jgi:hypothetical protein
MKATGIRLQVSDIVLNESLGQGYAPDGANLSLPQS